MRPTLLLAPIAACLATAGLAQTAQKPNPEDVATRNIPAGNARLAAMTLDKALFTPDQWWKFKGPSTHRPGHYVVEQQGLVSLGGKLIQNHGAQVAYRVEAFGSAAEAAKAWASGRPKATASSRARTAVKAVRLGDDAVEVQQTHLDASGAVQMLAARTYARYGRYIVDISGASDMKAFGPKPAKGPRAYLHEAVYARVRAEALARWNRAAELLPAADRP